MATDKKKKQIEMLQDFSNYAAFNISVEEIKDLNDNTIEINIDFTQIVDPYTRDEISENKISIDNYEELKSKLRLSKEKIKGKKIKQLRDKKGRFISKRDSKILRDLAKVQNKKVNTFKKLYSKSPKDETTEDRFNKKKKIIISETTDYSHTSLEDKIANIKNKISLTITTFDGDTYFFEGTGKEISQNSEFLKVFNREMNRVYRTIIKDNRENRS